jgi:hypothetical protein
MGASPFARRRMSELRNSSFTEIVDERRKDSQKYFSGFGERPNGGCGLLQISRHSIL